MEDQLPLPGFRFHPTDEELLTFYLRRRVEKKPITLGIFKEIDIYKYNPWDLASFYSSGGEKEWYFFCRRGRKYKNSMRPNRVTGCGFWKATGIDKSIYSPAATRADPHTSIVGLKKTLVFYRGSAGKGTKTDWMMHEFRLPSDLTNDLGAEIWTLCRIIKRNTLPKRHITSNRSGSSAEKNSISACSGESDHGERYISFSSPSIIIRACSEKRLVNNHINDWAKQEQQLKVGQMRSVMAQPAPSSSNMSPSASSFSINAEVDFDLLSYGNWDELRSVVDFDLEPSPRFQV